jgi:hypothetical protein
MAANPPHPPFIRIQRRAVARHAREVFHYSFSCYYFQISELGQSLQMLQPVLHLHCARSGSLGTLHPNRLAAHLPPAPLSLSLSLTSPATTPPPLARFGRRSGRGASEQGEGEASE